MKKSVRKAGRRTSTRTPLPSQNLVNIRVGTHLVGDNSSEDKIVKAVYLELQETDRIT